MTFYETGADSDREAFDIAWVQNRDTAVDTMNGFIEVYMDARGMKGAWEGLVYYANHERTEKIRALATHAQWFEDHLPIEPKYRKPKVQGVSAMAIEVVIEIGDSGPITPIGVNLPNDQRIREEHGSKSVSLSNVLEAYEQSMPDSYRQEFAWDAGEVARAKQWGAFASELTTEIHEVLGHGSGRMADHIQVTPQDLLKEQYSALEESRADLVALYFVADPYLATLGLVPAGEQQAVVQTEYEAYARNALVQLRRVRSGHPARRRSHAQPPGHRSLAAGQHQGDRGAAARRANLLRGDRRRSVPDWCCPTAGRSAADQVGGRLRRGSRVV